MTREEAIERLNIHKSTNVFVDSIAEAIDMAIEALSVANLKEEFESAVPNCQKCAIKELWEATEKEDLVSVVRCKDCRYQIKEKGIMWCSHEDGVCGDAPDNFYCAYGEKEDE